MRRFAVVELCGLLLVAGLARADEAPAPFRDPTVLDVKQQVERVDSDTLAWGRTRLAALDVEKRPAAERAARIARYVHDTFAFTPDRPPTVAAFIAAVKGNCYAHARLSALLLRLAGVPARFVYDVHLERKDPGATTRARTAGTGLFGEFHNDHFWVLYWDGSSWIPFDSALGIANRDDFRRVKIDEPAGGVANPPFLLWQESETPGAPMENVTRVFWQGMQRDTIPGVAAADWKALLDTVGRLEVEDLLRRPLSDERAAAIAHVGRQFFAAVHEP